MSRPEIELAVRRGRLLERIARERMTLGEQMQPVVQALGRVDQAVVLLRQGADWVRQHPLPVLGGVTLLAALRPRRAWRWGRRLFLAWKAVRGLQSRFFTR